jgi:hypothetical protein
VICGGGSSAHVLIPLLKDSIFDVSIYTSRPQEWSKTIELEVHDPKGNICGEYAGDLSNISSDPSELIPEADYIFLCMPVHKYRVCLGVIAPLISKDKTVVLGTAYGQGGFNWMVEEIKRQFDLNNIVYFAFGLIPWTSRTKKYGKRGILFGFKERTYAAVYPKEYFDQIRREFFDQISYKWSGKGKTENCNNFLSITMSVDNQIIHTSRCYGLYKVHGKSWKKREDVPMFYRDYDEVSANELEKLDEDYSKIRNAIMSLHPENDYHLMFDYLSLDKYTFNADENESVLDSFLNSPTLGSIKTPVVQNEEGEWEIDKNYRFFMDDIYYGICIVKWIAQQIAIDTPKIDEIIRWAQEIRQERLIDDNNHLLINSTDLNILYKAGLPCYYGMNSIDDCID